MTPGRDDDKIHPLARRFLFLDSPKFRGRVLYALGAAAILLALADLVVGRHAIFPFEGLAGFHAVFGFVAFAFVVLCGWPLRRLLGRREDYYGEGEEDV